MALFNAILSFKNLQISRGKPSSAMQADLSAHHPALPPFLQQYNVPFSPFLVKINTKTSWGQDTRSFWLYIFFLDRQPLT